MALPQPGHEHDDLPDYNEDLDTAHRELQDEYPGLDWEGPVNAAVSRALQAGFEIGRDFGNRYPI